jgi:2-oxoglutarate ferredoxin oxidoreductase subunit alpha
MAIKSVNWMAGGPQGSGVDTAANIFGRACGYGGLYVFGRREYHSNIKGLHSYFHLRVSKDELLANINDVNLLAAFDAETVVRHLTEVVPEGGIIVDSREMATKVLDIATLPPEFKVEMHKFMKENGVGETVKDWLEYAQNRQVQVFPVPYMELLNQIGEKLGIEKISKITRMINVLTIGVSLALFKFDRELAEKALKATFVEKEKIVEMNITALNYAYDYAEETFKDNFKHRIEKIPLTEERLFLTGNQAVAMGKVLGGCRVQTYYPITPAADESEYLEAHEILKTNGEDESVLVIQTEDEIAAIYSASGACLRGLGQPLQHLALASRL